LKTLENQESVVRNGQSQDLPDARCLLASSPNKKREGGREGAETSGEVVRDIHFVEEDIIPPVLEVPRQCPLVLLVYFINSVPTSQRTHRVLIRKLVG
jgi:hypothetical protein